MEFVASDDDKSVKYHSSTSQYKDQPLAVYRGGRWQLISFDSLDYIYCDKVISHRAVVTDGNDIGYHFPVGQMVIYNDKYVYHDNKTTELRVLPHWFGEGYYLESINKYGFVNSDTNSLGTRNRYDLSVGLDYALADDTLEPAEYEE